MRELGDDRAVAAAAEYHRIVTEIVTANDGIAIERTGDVLYACSSRQRAR